MLTHGQLSVAARAKTVAGKATVLAGVAFAALVLSSASTSAQSLFDSLFGRRPGPPASASSFADPFSGWNPFGWRPVEAPRTEIGGTVAFCVRLCDGRYFPIERHGGITPAHACSSFCPASPARIYNGGGIDSAIGSDGKPYRELGTAFLYREKILPGCTCNGKDPFGLASIPIEDDVTLRAGDIVATNTGLMAYNGNSGGRRRTANFTPIQSYSGLSAEFRRKLTETRIEPAARTLAPAPQLPPIADRRLAENPKQPKQRVQVVR